MLIKKSKDELKNVKQNMVEDTIVENVSAKTDTDVSLKKTTKKATKKAKSETTPKKKTVSKTKKVASDKESKKSSKSTDKKVSSTKTASSKKKTATKKTTKIASKRTIKKASSSKKQVTATVEYYDLPYRYNQTVVKILAQTPTMLFIYWDISDDDRNSYIQKYGESFFNDTKPVLIITNKTMNYTFEVEINDFANSWYLPLNDPDCDYSVELGRRPKYPNNQNNTNNMIMNNAEKDNTDNDSEIKYYQPLDNYIYICTSNDMEMPNNHILFDRLGKSVFFKNVKNNFIEEKYISSLSFITNIGKVYNIYDLYKEMYKDEINVEDLSSDKLNLNLSSSGGSSSSSTFK